MEIIVKFTNWKEFEEFRTGATVQKPAEAPKKPSGAEAKKNPPAQENAESANTAKQAAVPETTKADLMKIITDLCHAGRAEDVKAIFTDYGVTGLSAFIQAYPDGMPELRQKLEALNAG